MFRNHLLTSNIIVIRESKSFLEDCLQEFECCICFHYMHPPIRQCTKGHCYCNDCFEQMDNCPQCRSPHRPGLNSLLEEFHNLVIFPCKFKDEGCPTSTTGSIILKHERNCFVNWKRCPLSRFDSCTWNGPVKKAVAHCRDVHMESLHSGPNVTINWNNYTHISESNCRIHFVAHAFNDLFLGVFEVDTERDIVRWSLYLVGSSQDFLKYCFEIELESGDTDTGKVVMVSPCGSVTDGKVEIRSSINMYYHMTTKFCKENNLKCLVRIKQQAVISYYGEF